MMRLAMSGEAARRAPTRVLPVYAALGELEGDQQENWTLPTASRAGIVAGANRVRLVMRRGAAEAAYLDPVSCGAVRVEGHVGEGALEPDCVELTPRERGVLETDLEVNLPPGDDLHGLRSRLRWLEGPFTRRVRLVVDRAPVVTPRRADAGARFTLLRGFLGEEIPEHLVELVPGKAPGTLEAVLEASAA